MAPHEQRRLAAIMMLDVVGFSAMMAEDESATLARVLKVRREITDPIIEQYDGRVVKLMGDGALIEFASVTAAVQSAVELQKSLGKQTGENPITLRIDINLGDVIIEGDDIYGDGVNVAARIEALAGPGGIAVSSTVFEQVRQRLTVGFEDGGAHRVKNIPNPVQVYHLRPHSAAHSGQENSAALSVISRFSTAKMLSLIAVLVLGILALWWQSGGPVVQTKDVDKIAPLALLDKPSVAVLPFANLSGDIARNTSFSFRDQNEDARSAAAELGIRYLVEGSVQKSGGIIRINANLVDASTGIQVCG